MQGFYKSVMEEKEKRYQEAMTAAETSKASKKEGDSAAEDTPKEKTDREIAEEMRAQGKDIQLNDEGQIIDKRQTLSAGLNITKKPSSSSSSMKSSISMSLPSSRPPARSPSQVS